MALFRRCLCKLCGEEGATFELIPDVRQAFGSIGGRRMWSYWGCIHANRFHPRDAENAKYFFNKIKRTAFLV